jgi:hypothetical protein
MDRKSLQQYKSNLNLTIYQKDLLLGTLLGDATIVKQLPNRSHNIKFEQKQAASEYIYHLYEIMKPWVGTAPTARNIKGGNAADRQSIWFRTYRHEIFTFYYNEFYKNGKKVVPINPLSNLNDKSLTYWFMDDGHKTKSGYILNTHSFSLEECIILCNFLSEKFNLKVSIQKDHGSIRLYIAAESAFVI